MGGLLLLLYERGLRSSETSGNGEVDGDSVITYCWACSLRDCVCGSNGGGNNRLCGEESA